MCAQKLMEASLICCMEPKRKTKSVQNGRFLASFVEVGGARSLPLKCLKIQHRWSHVVNFMLLH